MILKYNHKFNNDFSEHTFSVLDSNDRLFCGGQIIANTIELFVDFNFQDERIFIRFDKNEHSQNLKEQPLAEKSNLKGWHTENEYMNALRTRFYDVNNNVIGMIKRQTVDSKVLWAQKFLFSFKNQNYIGYDVAKAGKGIYYFIVNENMQTVAAIKQATWGRNNIYNYSIFCENEFFAKLSVLFLVYADNNKYGGRHMLRKGGLFDFTSGATLVAQPQEVKERYDPGFIQRIKEME